MKGTGPTLEGPWDGPSGRSDVLDETIVHGSEAAAALEETRTVFAAGTAVSRYVVLYEVGAGGMGVVYAAFDPQLNRKIALKILTPKPRQRRRGVDQAVTRLMREAQAIARLSHPNVVNVYDVGRHGDAVFVAMEFIEGDTLTRWLQLEDRTLAEICEVFAKAGRGLEAAHRAGLVHRDFKPDNVLVSPDGRVRVLDFGLARADPNAVVDSSQPSGFGLDDSDDAPMGDGVPQPRDFADSDVLSSPLTLDDAVVGTPRYMAPEQHVGAGVDGRSDQFSFCVALYQALYRQEPFPANRLQALVLLKQEGRVAEVSSDTGVPMWLEDLTMRGLSPIPAERWPSMNEIVAALEQDPEGTRRRWVALGSGAVLLAAVTAVVGHRLGAGGEGPCQDGSSYLEGLWDDDRREVMREAIVGTELSYAEHTWGEVERRLDDDLERWQEAYRGTCEATRVRGDQSDELLDLRMACLNHHLHELRVVVDILEDADPAVVQRAVSLVSGVSSFDSCSEADAEQLRERTPLPDDPAAREQIEQLRQKLREASAQRRASRTAQGRRLAEEVLTEAEALRYEPLRVEALLAVGIALEHAGEYDTAETKLRSAVWDSLRAGHDSVAARAATQLVSVVGDRLARYDEGLLWYEQSSALLDRQAATGSDRSSLFNNVGNVWHRKGDNDEALSFYRRALEITEAVAAPDDPVLGTQRLNLGNAQLRLGQYDAALSSYEEAQVILVRALGEGHPQIAMAVASLGIVYNETERYEQALVQFRKALPQFEAWLGPEHLFVASTLSNVGQAQRGLKRYGEAEATLRRAQELFEKSLGTEHPQVASCVASLADVRSAQGFHADALRLQERVLAMRTKRLDEGDEAVVATRAAIAELWRLRGNAEEARTALEGLLAAEDADSLPPQQRAELHLLLAKARWDTNEPYAQVRSELARARVLLREASTKGRQVLRDLEDWEREHTVDDRTPPPGPTPGSTTPPAPPK